MRSGNANVLANADRLWSVLPAHSGAWWTVPAIGPDRSKHSLIFYSPRGAVTSDFEAIATFHQIVWRY